MSSAVQNRELRSSSCVTLLSPGWENSLSRYILVSSKPSDLGDRSRVKPTYQQQNSAEEPMYKSITLFYNESFLSVGWSFAPVFCPSFCSWSLCFGLVPSVPLVTLSIPFFCIFYSSPFYLVKFPHKQPLALQKYMNWLFQKHLFFLNVRDVSSFWTYSFFFCLSH